MASVHRAARSGKGSCHEWHKGFHRLLWVLTSAILGWSHGADAQSVALQCQVDGGGWKTCLMHVQEIGRTWNIQMGQETVFFRHDGGGAIAMKQQGGDWKLVQTHWIAVPASNQPALCWDSLCALGAVPLD